MNLCILYAQGEESEEMKRASRTSFKIIARSYLDPAKAESDIADFFMQLRDTDLLKQFTKLLEPNTSFSESMSLVVYFEADIICVLFICHYSC